MSPLWFVSFMLDVIINHSILSVFVLSAFMLSAVILSAVMLSVVMLSVAASGSIESLLLTESEQNLKWLFKFHFNRDGWLEILDKTGAFAIKHFTVLMHKLRC